jgi:hypothetical protein
MVGFRLAEVLETRSQLSSVAFFQAAMINVRLSQSVRALVAAAVVLFSSPLLLASTPAAPVVPASLDLRVADASGGAITDAIVLIQRGEAAPVTASSTDLGRYHLDGLTPGHYVVTVA